MDRLAVVSGGGTGMGRETARELARHGDRVLIIGRRPSVLAETAEKLNLETGVDLVSWRSADLSDPAQVEGLVDGVDIVDVLVNNAGGAARSATPSLREVRDAWVQDFESNVLTAVLLTTAFGYRIRRPGGRIITISSIAALRGGVTRTRRPRPR